MNENDDRFSPELLRGVLIASFGSLLLNLGSTSVNVAIDRLMTRFDAPLSTAQWIITGYLLALAFVLPAFRRMIERLGSRRLYIVCLLAFTATSLLCACAWSIGSLIAFRMLQGAVGGLLTPLAQSLAAQLAGPKRMGRAIGIMSVPILVAPLLGPTLGGLIIEHLSWRWLFLFNTPLGVLGAWLAWRHLPEGNAAKRGRLDVVGLALLSPGIALFVYAVSLVGHARAFTESSLLALGIAGALIVTFVLDARRRPTTALIDLRLFRNPRFDAALFAYLVTAFGEFGAQLVLPLYYQQVRGESAMATGLLLAPQGLGMLLTLPRAGRLADRMNSGVVVIGGVLVTLLGTLAFGFASDHTSYWLLGASLVFRGAGLGATAAPALSAAYKQLPHDDIPNGTASINIVQRLGAPLGTAAMAITLQWFSVGGKAAGAPPADAFAHTFAISAAFSALALFSGLVLARGSRRVA
ncbi:MAG TPA: DHA2 family efflux MFS transporter permease subunit [Kofleriaceae bacterium]|jgi:EmrB/QacA subfamily drug resistance transporter